MNLRVFLFNKTGDFGWLREIYKNPPLPYFDMYDNGGFRFMILPSASFRLSR